MTLRRAAALVFLVGVCARAAWLFGQGQEVRRAMSADSHGYVRLAVNLREHARFSLDREAPFAPDTIRTPGYPVFLAIFRGPRAALWTQAALGAAAAALVTLTAGALGATGPAAFAVGLFLAVDLVSVAYAGQILTDVLFQFLVALALWLLAGGGLARGGLVLGAAALTRPIGLYLPFPLAATAAFLAPPTRGRRAAAVLLASGLALPAFWVARNKAESGVATFSSIQGLNALLRAGVVRAEETGKPYGEAYAELDALLREGRTFASPAEEGKAAGKLAARYLARHPFLYLKVCAKDLLKLFGGHGLDLLAWTHGKDPRYDPMAPDVVSGGFSGTRQLLARYPFLKIVLAAYWAFLLVIYFTAARGLWALARARDWKTAAIPVVPLAYFLALTLGMGAYYRLRLPLMPPLLLLAAFGLRGPSR